MVQPEEDKNRALQQDREANPRETGQAVGHPPPHAGEKIGRKEPPFEVVGTDAISPLLMHVDFPATKEEVKQRIGQAQVAIDQKHTMSVAEILEKVGPDSFRSSREVEEAVNHVWDRIQPHPDQRGSHNRQRDDLTKRRPN